MEKRRVSTRMSVEIIKLKQENEKAKDERRRMWNCISRLSAEIKYVHTENKENIELIRRRQEDTDEYLEKVKKYSDWAFKTALGVLIAVIITACVQLLFGFGG